MTQMKHISAWVAAVLLVVVYLYAVIAAYGNLSGMIGLGGALGTGLSITGWLWLIGGLVLPLIVLGAALLLGRGKTAWTRVLLIALGLAVVAALQIDIMHVVPQASYFA